MASVALFDADAMFRRSDQPRPPLRKRLRFTPKFFAQLQITGLFRIEQDQRMHIAVAA